MALNHPLGVFHFLQYSIAQMPPRQGRLAHTLTTIIQKLEVRKACSKLGTVFATAECLQVVETFARDCFVGYDPLSTEDSKYKFCLADEHYVSTLLAVSSQFLQLVIQFSC